LPIEHEDEHRRLAGKVVEGGLNGPKVEVSREEEAPATTPGKTQEEGVREGVKNP
jgi:hypothetical protein